jgi:hypothetical protein
MNTLTRTLSSTVGPLACAAAVLVLLAPAPATAQSSSDTATASASATVVSAITITKDVDLDFGDVVAGATAGTVVMSNAGALSATGGTTLGNAGTAAAASFTVNGDGSSTYAITLPSVAITLSDGATNEMTVDTFTSNPGATSTLDGGGSDTIAVGAILNVGASQVSGSYAGTFDVTVAYN